MAYFLPNPTEFRTTADVSSNYFVSGLKIRISQTGTSFSISHGCARDLISPFVISVDPLRFPNGITVDIFKLGLNGCFPYLPSKMSLPYNTVFPVYIVANQSGTGSDVTPAIIVATGDNFLPDSYDSYARIGWIYIKSSGTGIDPWIQSGEGMDRTYQLLSQRNRLFNGLATTMTEVSLTNFNGIVPPKFGVTALLMFYGTTTFVGAGTFGAVLNSVNSVDPGALASWLFIPSTTGSAGYASSVVCGLNEDATDAVVYYRNTNAGNTFNIDSSGFVDNLGPSLY